MKLIQSKLTAVGAGAFLILLSGCSQPVGPGESVEYYEQDLQMAEKMNEKCLSEALRGNKDALQDEDCVNAAIATAAAMKENMETRKAGRKAEQSKFHADMKSDIEDAHRDADQAILDANVKFDAMEEELEQAFEEFGK